MESLKIWETLEKEGLPFPVSQCGACGKTMWRKGNWFQCPDCGATSTQFGGTFTHTEASVEWVAECAVARSRIDEITAIPA